MWPQIPEDLNSLSAAQLNDLAKAIRSAISEAGKQLTAETAADINTWSAKRLEIVALAKARAAQELADSEAADEAAAEQAAADQAAAAAAADEAAAAAAAEAAEAEAKELAAVGAAGKVVRTTFGPSSTPVVPPASDKSILPYLTAKDGVEGKKAGDTFDTWGDLATAMIKRADSIRGNTVEKFQVASILANYPAERQLGDNLMLNAAKFEPDEIQAAFCAPATPYYGIVGLNATRRPVFGSLPQFQNTQRMQVSIMPSPSLSDITSGYGIWSDTDDDNANKVKACATITCGSPTTYKMYGVWRCLTVKNLLAMSYPELVEAWLNRLAAAHARLAEQTLLNAMASGCTNISAPRLGYGGTTSILSTILNYLALYQETQRWDITGNMEAWAPRWVLWGIKMDLFRRRQINSGMPSVASDAQVEALFANAGINIHWFMDTPSYAVAIPAVGASVLNLIPQSVQILIAPPGKFALMDRGELSIGVTGNGMYRDTTSNARNQFTFFFENFEGIVNTNTLPAHILDIPVCWNGVQIDDIVINCQGGDEMGYQS